MLFNKKGAWKCFGLLLVLSIIFGHLFVGCSDANAWTLDDPFFTNSSIGLTRSYGSQADGAPYLVQDQYTSSFNLSDYIYGPTDSAIQTKKVFGIYALGFNMYGGNSANKYQTGQAIFYFTTNKASYETFANSIHYSAIYHKLSGATEEKACNASSSLTESTPNLLIQQVECRQVTNSNYDPYVSVDLRIGETPSFFDSPAWYVYRNGGGVKFSSNVGQYIVSSSDNESELAMEEINNTLNIIYQQNGEYYQHEYDAIDNIENQSPDDMDVGTGSYTNLIGLLQGFVVMLQTPRMINCELTLPFPNFAGGSVTVNPCSYKEKAPAIVQWGSSLLLVTFFIPFAFMVLKLIYNEIRSWTNG